MLRLSCNLTVSLTHRQLQAREGRARRRAKAARATSARPRREAGLWRCGLTLQLDESLLDPSQLPLEESLLLDESPLHESLESLESLESPLQPPLESEAALATSAAVVTPRATPLPPPPPGSPELPLPPPELPPPLPLEPPDGVLPEELPGAVHDSA